MVKVNYNVNGAMVEVEVSEEVAACLTATAKAVKQNNRKETRRHRSMDALGEKGIEFMDERADTFTKVEYRLFLLEMKKLLTKKQWLVFEKVYVDGKSYEIAANELKINLFALQKTIKIVNKKYFEKLLKKGGGNGGFNGSRYRD